MDINQSAFSGYQSNKTKTNRTGIETRATSDASRLKDTSASSSSQSIKQLDLKEGQQVKGQVIDIRYNEVKVQLDPGKQIVTARLSGDVPLSIGQEAHFQVTEEASDHLVLKYLPEETSSPNDATIQKALTATNLPSTDRNRAIVSELLNQRMPIDKQTLQMMVKLSVTNREASPLTLVLMYKNQIPMTSANIKQFEAYQNGTHQLLNDIKAISQNISEMIKQEATTQNPSTTLNTLLQENVSNSSIDTNNQLSSAMQMNGELIDILYSNSKAASTTAFDTQISNILNKEELTLISQAMEQNEANNPVLTTGSLTGNPAGVPADIAKQISNGTFSLNEAVTLLAKLYTQQQSDPNLFDTQTGPELLNQLKAQGLASDTAADHAITKLIDQFLQLQDNSAKLSDIISSEGRNNLLNNLSGLPDMQDMKDSIAQGSSSLKQTLTFIQENLAGLDKNTAGKLLQSPEYSKLLEEAFLHKWTITPEKTGQKAPVSELYRELKEDLEKLNMLTNSGKDNPETLRLQEPVKNMQDNLQFMKDLNDVYTYLQLPLQFRNQNTHTDLYVMTRKKALSDNRENLSVLLHLDMVNLGALNIHLQMNSGNKVQADFYIEDTEAGHIIKENLPSLTAALEKKGYSVIADVKDTYKKPDFSKNFIEQSSQDNNILRYTFDIRT